MGKRHEQFTKKETNNKHEKVFSIANNERKRNGNIIYTCVYFPPTKFEPTEERSLIHLLLLVI